MIQEAAPIGAARELARGTAAGESREAQPLVRGEAAIRGGLPCDRDAIVHRPRRQLHHPRTV